MNPRVQLNISVLPEEKLALQALAEGRGLSVTRLVLSLIYASGFEGAVPGPPAESPAGVSVADPVVVAPTLVAPELDELVNRSFRPFSKESQAGRRPKEKR